MRRLPLLSPLLFPRSSPAHCTLTQTSTYLVASYTQPCSRASPQPRVVVASSTSAAAMSTASAAAAAASAAGHFAFPFPENSGAFTSFELESELMGAEEDMAALQPVTHAPESQPPPRRMPLPPAAACRQELVFSTPSVADPPRSSPLSSPTGARARHSHHTPEAQLTTPPLAAVALPNLLLGRRWLSQQRGEQGRDEHASYVPAARRVLRKLHQVWAALETQQGDAAVMEHQRAFRHLACETLAKAHAEALLVLLELLLAPRYPQSLMNGSPTVCDATLLAVVLELMCERHAELAGKHVAHVSRLLVNYAPFLFVQHSPLHAICAGTDGVRGHSRNTADSPSQRHQHLSMTMMLANVKEEVWERFVFLCYATRGQLRRQHNIDCLAALLWGTYAPQDKEGKERGNVTTRQMQSKGGRSSALTSPLVPNARVVRRATLQHLLHRALQTAPSAEVDTALAWAVLMAANDMDDAVRDAVVHRLSRRAEANAAHLTTAPASVRQWKALALRFAETLVGDPASHGKGGRALLPGPAVFARLDDEARRSGGWAVPSMDKTLLMALRCPGESRTEASDTAGLGATRHHKGSIGQLSVGTEEAQLRLHDAVRATLAAYARLRWGPLLSDTEVTPAAAAALAPHGGLSGREGAALRRSIDSELAEVSHTAADLPQHAQLLAEGLAVKLVRLACLREAVCSELSAAPISETAREEEKRLRATGKSDPRHEELLSTLRQLARSSQSSTLMHAILLDATVPWGAGPHEGSGCESLCRPPAFLAEAASVVAERRATVESALRVAEEWTHRHAMAAAALPLPALAAVGEWIRTSDRWRRSSEVAATLQRAAERDVTRAAAAAGEKTAREVEEDVDERASPTHSASKETSDAERRRLWGVIVSAFQAEGAVAAEAGSAHAPDSADSRRKVERGEEKGQACATLAVAPVLVAPSPADPRTALLLKRLQWVALLNADPGREWRLCGRAAVASSERGVQLRVLVKASEQDALAPGDEKRLYDQQAEAAQWM